MGEKVYGSHHFFCISSSLCTREKLCRKKLENSSTCDHDGLHVDHLAHDVANRNLKNNVQEGLFRQDLYYRLCDLELVVLALC